MDDHTNDMPEDSSIVLMTSNIDKSPDILEEQNPFDDNQYENTNLRT